LYGYNSGTVLALQSQAKILCRTAISWEHQKESMQMIKLYLSWEDVIAKGVDGVLVGISELEATVHEWSSESVLNGFSETTTHVDTLSRAERISQVSLS